MSFRTWMNQGDGGPAEDARIEALMTAADAACENNCRCWGLFGHSKGCPAAGR